MQINPGFAVFRVHVENLVEQGTCDIFFVIEDKATTFKKPVSPIGWKYREAPR